MDAENLHDLAISALERFQRWPLAMRGLGTFTPPSYPRLLQELWGLRFAHPAGLAAGWDKNVRVPAALAALGFGFLELGTVTLWPEPGRPRPRIFRSFSGQWIVNRVGFANEGASAVLKRFQNGKTPNFGIPVGLSLGKMPFSSPDRLVEEVSEMLNLFSTGVDFFTVNISSPNTPKGFELSRPSFLREALSALRSKTSKPFLVKVPPLIEAEGADGLCRALLDAKIDGVIATNSSPTPYGGLSGLPLKFLALKTTARLYQRLGKKIPVIGVGGILTPGDAWRRVAAGARLIQIFSGFVFSGPGLLRNIARHLDRELERRGMKNIEEACGIEADQWAR